jgi:hypothetical protein
LRSDDAVKLVALLVSAPCWGCDVGEPPVATVDDSAPGTSALQVATIWNQLPRINAKPYVSAVGTFDIDVFVAGDIGDFRKIHPETTGSGVTVTIGTVIVRSVLDAGGNVSKLTLMAKGPPGYDPTIGDWWFGETDATGTPLVDGGVVQVGRLTACHTCHLPRATDDFLFGVPVGD